MLHAIDVQREVQVALESKNRSRIDYIDMDITFIMKKARKKVEGEVIGIKISKDKQKLWSRVLSCK